MSIETKADEHTEQPGASSLGIIFAKVAHIRRFVRSETGYRTLYGFFIVTVLGFVRG